MCDAYGIEPNRGPWNKGKLIGQKPPLQPKHVWAIRTKLQLDGRMRDLALFNIAIDSKLRGCDVVRLSVEDVTPLERPAPAGCRAGGNGCLCDPVHNLRTKSLTSLGIQALVSA